MPRVVGFLVLVLVLGPLSCSQKFHVPPSILAMNEMLLFEPVHSRREKEMKSGTREELFALSRLISNALCLFAAEKGIPTHSNHLTFKRI